MMVPPVLSFIGAMIHGVDSMEKYGEVPKSMLPQGVGGSDPQQKMDYPFLTPDDA